MFAATCHLIERTLGIDVTDPQVRQRAWRRLQVYRRIADECEQDGNDQTAAMLRSICRRAISSARDDDALICLAILAGLTDDP
jgi:hypothetical protein